MHCPRCGQQQVSDEIKFCSRCGFSLGLVSDIVAHGGFLPQLDDLKQDKSWLTRKNGVAFALLWLIFFLPLCTIIIGGIFDNEILGGITAAIGVFGSLMILIASLIWLKPAPKPYSQFAPNQIPNANPQNLYGAKQTALPEATQQFVPPPGAWKAPNTGELVSPGSVTDPTTKLLQRDE